MWWPFGRVHEGLCLHQEAPPSCCLCCSRVRRSPAAVGQTRRGARACKACSLELLEHREVGAVDGVGEAFGGVAGKRVVGDRREVIGVGGHKLDDRLGIFRVLRNENSGS